jgi:2,3-bisphosphoglycerate-dependent phosphoglycerate mutase
MRHGRTDATDNGVFVGWLDPPLNEGGLAQSAAAADILRQHHMLPDRAHCSELARSVRTCQIILAALSPAVTARSSWYLNERHYGALQGMPKSAVYQRFGPELYQSWRRSYSAVPPEQGAMVHRALKAELAAAGSTAVAPRAESLEMVRHRVSDYWDRSIEPDLRGNQTVLVVAHSNSLRALIMHIEKLSPSEIQSVNIPVAMPFIYEFYSRTGHQSERQYLDPTRAAVAAQEMGREGLPPNKAST